MENLEIKDLVIKKQNDLMNIFLTKEQEIFELKKQEQIITAKRKFIENELEELKEKVKTILEENGIQKIETEQGKISIRLNPISIDVIDIDKVPEEYKTIKTIVNVDKKKITDNFKITGELIDGVQINTNNTSLQIK